MAKREPKTVQVLVPPPRMGRPTVLTDEIVERVAAKLEAGHFFEHVVMEEGIGRRSGYRWVDRGEAELERRAADRCISRDTCPLADACGNKTKPRVPKVCGACGYTAQQWLETSERAAREQVYVDFWQARERARGVAVAGLVDEIRSAAQTTRREAVDWRAAAWLAERLDPQAFHIPARLEVTGSAGGPVQVEGRAEALARFAEAVRESSVEPDEEVDDGRVDGGVDG